MIGGSQRAEVLSRRLDQWLWFARLIKSRSVAGRLCAEGAVSVNQAARKPNHLIRVGDIVVLPQGRFRRTVRVLGLGMRRGPPTEARQLYEEAATPARLSTLAPDWTPLLADNEPEDDAPEAYAGRSPP